MGSWLQTQEGTFIFFNSHAPSLTEVGSVETQEEAGARPGPATPPRAAPFVPVGASPGESCSNSPSSSEGDASNESSGSEGIVFFFGDGGSEAGSVRGVGSPLSPSFPRPRPPFIISHLAPLLTGVLRYDYGSILQTHANDNTAAKPPFRSRISSLGYSLHVHVC